MTAEPPAAMRAAVLREFGQLGVEDVDTPVPGPGEVLVRVRACGICGTDLKIVNGAYRGTWPPALPFIIGHEWSGEVAALGPGAERSGLRPGQRVVAENHTGCASCPMCRAGRYNLCERVREPGFKLYGHTAPGALAEYAVRPAVALHPVPDSVSEVSAALVNQGALTVHAARRTGLGAGDSVAVFGPGLLGLLMIQVARAAGATDVIMVGRAGGWPWPASSAAPPWSTTSRVTPWPASARRPAGAGRTTCTTARGTPRSSARPWVRSGAVDRWLCSAWLAGPPPPCRWTG